MKILLINPPSENELIGNNPSIIEEERGYNPPLGILYIAGYLEKHTDFHVEVLDTQAEEINYNALETCIRNKSPDIVGITAMTFTLIDVIKVVQLVKKIHEKTKVILGGPHVHIFPNETIAIPGVDYLVLGEGEVAFKELVEHIDDTQKLKHLPGIVFRDKGHIINTGIRPLNESLDALPFPARHMTQIHKYSSLMAKRSPITTMFTSRGCPCRCTFCDRPHLGKNFRARSAVNVVDEMEACVKLGIHEFLIYDDTFTINKKRVIEVCDEILRRKLDIGWDIRARVNTIDTELLKKLKAANCERIHYGVESGNPHILKILNKGITIDGVRTTFQRTKEAGISVLAYFMIGCPTETKKEIMETITFAKELKPDFAHITIFTPFPATEIYKKGLHDGIIKTDFWREFAQNPKPGFQPRCWEENFTREELQELIVYAYKSFYTRPSYILKKLTQIRSFDELKRMARAGLKVFGMQP
ncbi:MAG: B12-binding domain-containing radical SAM protein [Candidatus Brocadiaceae bacterium]|nr:B12-binding domain-containing radical SAM protein [Candidatus Brocadiaceae bacterium]